MKDYTMSKKHKRSSSSNSSHYTISDDESPKYKHVKKDVKVVEGRHRHNHRKHNKHHRHQGGNESSDEGGSSNNKTSTKERGHKHNPENEDSRNSYKTSGKERGHKYDIDVKVKEEPPSEDERDKKYKNKQNDQIRTNSDSLKRNVTRQDREDSRNRSEQADGRSGREHQRRPLKEDPLLSTSAEPEWGKKEIKTEKKEPAKNNAKPDFGLSGKLTEDANTFNGVVIKYSEPPEARKPKRRWRLYPFKGETSLPTLHIHRQSAYLLGRDRKVADIPIDHPSCSKQHAALQYRLVPFTRNDGSSGRQIKLYVIDLESANGTFLNNKKIEPKKYYEMKERDVIKFGFSSREYVLLHEHSKDSEEDDNVNND